MSIFFPRKNKKISKNNGVESKPFNDLLPMIYAKPPNAISYREYRQTHPYNFNDGVRIILR